MKTSLVLSLSALSILLSANSVLASGSVRCETQYGGGQVCVTSSSVQVDKKVCDISTKNCDPDQNYFDNMTLSNHIFQIGEQVIYRIKVTNTTNETVSKVTVTDSLPNYLVLNPNSTNNKTSYEITNLKPGASDVRRIDTLVTSNLPQGMYCVLNKVQAQAAGEQPDEDTAQVCLGKGALVTTVPQAGPEASQLILISSLLLTGSGIFLNKFAR